MYRLDIETLLLLLRGRSGLLETSIQSVAGLKGRCQVVVMITNGKIVSCTLSDKQGNTLAGEHALQALQKKVLEWNYQEKQEPPTIVQNSPALQRPLDVPSQMSPRRYFGNGQPFQANPGNQQPSQPPQPNFGNGQPSQPNFGNGQPSQPNFGNGQPFRANSGNGPRLTQAIPQKIGQPPPALAQAWTRQQRTIFMLIDNARTIAMIAQLLQQDEASVTSIIIDMAQHNIVKLYF